MHSGTLRIAFLYRRGESLALYWRGVIVHSRYAGDPWLATKIVRDPHRARAFEPFMCLVIGSLVCLFAPKVGLFVMAGFISLSVKHCLDSFTVYNRVRQMRDAQIEGEFYAEEFKKGR